VIEAAQAGHPLSAYECERMTRDGQALRVRAYPLALCDPEGRVYAVATVETPAAE
jgi:hypothetical protein